MTPIPRAITRRCASSRVAPAWLINCSRPCESSPPESQTPWGPPHTYPERLPPQYRNARGKFVGVPRWSPMMRSPIRPMAMPTARGIAAASNVFSTDTRARRTIGIAATTHPTMPPIRLIPPL